MLKVLVGGLVFLSSVFVQAHNLDETDIKTCNNKQFLVKLWQSKLSFEQQKELVLKSAKAVGFHEQQINVVSKDFPTSKEIIIQLKNQRAVASANTAEAAQFKKLVDKLNSYNEISYAECNVNFDGKW